MLNIILTSFGAAYIQCKALSSKLTHMRTHTHTQIATRLYDITEEGRTLRTINCTLAKPTWQVPEEKGLGNVSKVFSIKGIQEERVSNNREFV